jgi:hypothetical protein
MRKERSRDRARCSTRHVPADSWLKGRDLRNVLGNMLCEIENERILEGVLCKNSMLLNARAISG